MPEGEISDLAPAEVLAALAWGLRRGSFRLPDGRRDGTQGQRGRGGERLAFRTEGILSLNLTGGGTIRRPLEQGQRGRGGECLAFRAEGILSLNLTGGGTIRRPLETFQ